MVFEITVLSDCGPKGGEVTQKWRRLHNEELYDLYCSLNIIWVITSSRMRCGMQGRQERYIYGFGEAT
jgi:hypothetical protein